MKRIGIHIRLNNSIMDAIKKAESLDLKIFQNFFLNDDGKYIVLSDTETKDFLKARKNFDAIIAHCSYWINLCNPKEYNVKLLNKEIEMAKRLEYTQIVLHPGSAKELGDKMAGIDLLAKRLDKVLRQNKNIKIVLENTSHANFTVGSSLEDFKILQDKLDNQLNYCLDTAHAYAHGYDIKNDPIKFIEDVRKYMGIQNVVLIHLNDSMESLGSNKDRHGIPGEGKIGLTALQNFIKIDGLATLPVILELPSELDEKSEKEIIELFK